ncbi:MAG TPA: GlxA family transcriptional regulator [Solirubrobacteraceae bacterium]|jgi:transcriptional regulator GlxA family with amidase domain|nr:GlxA family transcriptional regulator [Solirubrobacteraceae bacterium]
MSPSQPRRVVLLAFPDVQILDVTGPSEVFAIADRICSGAYSIELVAPGAGELQSSGSLRLVADRDIEHSTGPIDTLLVAGGLGVRTVMEDRPLLDWLAAAAARSRRVASVCTGAFLLAQAGLLDGKRATTHWSACRRLAEDYPSVQVELDSIFVRDESTYTSAGISAGIDLALALVEEDLGSRVALQIARTLVLFMRRPGGQAQFSNTLESQSVQISGLRELQAWIADHLNDDLSVSALAQRAFMSPRNFARVFASQTGQTPGRYVESLRIERARTLLQGGERTIEGVARACGFGTVETLRRSFSRRLGVSPSDYRDRFKETP